MYSRKYIRPSVSVPSAIRREERAVSPPPDYTGVAFAPDRQSRQDFPETLIQGRPAPAEDFLETAIEAPEAEQALPCAEEPFAPLFEEDREPRENFLPPAKEDSPEPILSGTVFERADASHTIETAPAAEPPFEVAAPPPAEERTDPPLLTLSLLKSLTLEDLLLYWILLMLLVSSQEDQVYLLLGLLLLSR